MEIGSEERTIRRRLIVRLAVYLGLLLIGGFWLALCRRGHTISCLWKREWGILCPSCGATRALMKILELDFAAAFSNHPIFTTAIYPIAFLLCFQDLIFTVRAVFCPGKDKSSLLRFFFERRSGQ